MTPDLWRPPGVRISDRRGARGGLYVHVRCPICGRETRRPYKRYRAIQRKTGRYLICCSNECTQASKRHMGGKPRPPDPFGRTIRIAITDPGHKLYTLNGTRCRIDKYDRERGLYSCTIPETPLWVALLTVEQFEVVE